MWKWGPGFPGLPFGAFVGFEPGAWLFYNSFDGGGIMGFALGLPLGALTFAISGYFSGRRLERAGGRLELGLAPWHDLVVVIVLVLIAFVVRWMSTIRPFTGFQTWFAREITGFMQRFKIVHNTYYNFSGPVTLGPHELRLRPRVDHEMRIESSKLTLRPPAAAMHWHRDVESNSVAIATFDTPANQLAIESELIIEQYNEKPLDFLVAPEAVHYPFEYSPDDAIVLQPYLEPVNPEAAGPLEAWIAGVWKTGEAIQTYGLLERLNRQIHETMKYRRREEPGVQTPAQTLGSGTGSCRDFATLLMEAARRLGLASRFVSGYLHVPPSIHIEGATHAWTEAYLPGAGWKGFDPTIGAMAGEEHFAVAVARSPEAVPPVAGSFTGPPGSSMDVGVWVARV